MVGLAGNALGQGIDRYITHERDCWSGTEMALATLLGGIGGGVSKIPGLNYGKTTSGGNNLLARANSVTNSGRAAGFRTQVNFVMGHSPFFLQEPVPQAAAAGLGSQC